MFSEIPFLLGLGFALYMFHQAAPRVDFPVGSNWPMYLESALHFWDPTYPYNDWRPPAYPFLLAIVGAKTGFMAGAQMIALFSGYALVFSAALGGRALAGPLAGGGAALIVPWLRCSLESTAWLNMYPMAAAACGLSIAMGLLASRYGSMFAALMAGLLATLGWQTNHLVSVGIPVVAGLVLLGMLEVKWPRALGLLLALAVGIGTAYAASRYVVNTWRIPQSALGSQLSEQHRLSLLSIWDDGDPRSRSVKVACQGLETEPLSIQALLHSPCASALRNSNYVQLKNEDCIPGWSILLYGLPLSLLPMRWGRGKWLSLLRSSAASALVFFLPLAVVWAGSSWVIYHQKYALAFVPVMAMVAPVAIFRLTSCLGILLRIPKVMQGIAAVTMALLITYVWPRPSSLNGDVVRFDRTWDYYTGVFARWAGEHVGPSDLMVDCVPLHLNLVLAPQKIPYQQGVIVRPECMEAISHPPTLQGNLYLLTRRFRGVSFTHPSYIESQGWTLLRTEGGEYDLWERKSGAE